MFYVYLGIYSNSINKLEDTDCFFERNLKNLQSSLFDKTLSLKLPFVCIQLRNMGSLETSLLTRTTSQ